MKVEEVLRWPLHEVIARQSEADAENRGMQSTAPIYRHAAAQRISALEQAFRNGDKYALMKTIEVCALHEFVVPDWASKAYIEAFRSIERMKVRSWDQAFGPPFKKGVHLHEAAQRQRLAPAVFAEVREVLALDPASPIDDGLFEQVGKRFGIGKTLAKELYYERQSFYEAYFSQKSP